MTQCPENIQATTAIAEKPVRLLKSAIAVVSAKAIVACIEKQSARVERLEILIIKKAPSSNSGNGRRHCIKSCGNRFGIISS